MRDTANMLDIIDELNTKGVQNQDLLVSFDIINMFPSIDNQAPSTRMRIFLKTEVFSSVLALRPHVNGVFGE